jgi:predicted DNA-binding transcriptional regulator AlpA
MGENGTASGRGAGRESGTAPVLPMAGKGQGTRPECSPLPAGCMPRGLSRVWAAAYVGISPTLFDRAVSEGKMPKPFRLYGRVLWDIRKLDAAITALDTDYSTDDPWERMAL